MTSIGRKWSLFVGRTTRALKHPNYRVFFIGQLFSLIGNWITNIATSWLIYRLTGSAVLLGVVSFAAQFPGFLISPFAGVHVDRLNRRKVLIVTQALSSIQSLTLGVLTLTGTITIPQLIGLSIFQALIDGFYIPARQSFISELLTDRRDLANAIALNSASFHAARLIGPAIGGLLIAFASEGICFVVDALSYLAVLISLFTIRTTVVVRPRYHQSVMDELREGVRYILGNQTVWLLLANMAFFCLIGIGHTVLLPVLVKQVFRGGPEDLGFLMGASGLGALLGALTLAAHTSTEGILLRIKRSTIIFGFAVCALSLAPSILFAFPILVCCGFSFITVAAGSNTLIQTMVDDRMRGRVMSFFAMSFTGMMPLGSILSGISAEHLSAQWTIAITGILAIISASIFIIYSKKLKKLV